MDLLEVGGSKVKRTFINLDNLTRLVRLEGDRIEIYVGDFFDVISKGDKGYAELLKLSIASN